MTSTPGWEDAGDLPGGGINKPTDPVTLFHELSGATAYAADQPKQRYSHEAKGKVLFFPRTSMVMVPFEFHRDGSWSCVVVVSDPGNVYKPWGFSLHVSQAEIETALELDLEAVLVDHSCCRANLCARCQSNPQLAVWSRFGAAIGR